MEKNECRRENGALVCERTKERKDGTKVVLASVTKRMDGNCNPITEKMSGEDVALGKLNKFMDNDIQTTCEKAKNKPDDY